MKSKLLNLKAAFFLAAFLMSLPFAEAGYQATPQGSARISGFELKEEVALDPSSTSFSSVGVLRGTYTADSSWTLMLNNRPLPKRGNAFAVKIRLTGERTVLKFSARHSSGKIENQNVIVASGEPAKTSSRTTGDEPRPATPRKGYALGVALGPTMISFRQTSFADLSIIALTGKASLNFPLSSRWDLGGSAYMNLVSLSKNLSAVDARSLGLNVRAGYTFFSSGSLRASLLGGWYYTTMMVSGGRFGFKNMMGPQIYPTVRWMAGRSDAINGYFKFSPIASGGFALMPFSNREIAGGLAWAHVLSGGKAAVVSVDAANLGLVLNGYTIQSQTLSLAVGLNF